MKFISVDHKWWTYRLADYFHRLCIIISLSLKTTSWRIQLVYKALAATGNLILTFQYFKKRNFSIIILVELLICSWISCTAQWYIQEPIYKQPVQCFMDYDYALIVRKTVEEYHRVRPLYLTYSWPNVKISVNYIQSSWRVQIVFF